MIGDHIRTLKAGRWNHAIDCGDETVIGLAVDDAEQRRIRRSYRPEFVAGAESVEVVTHRERTFPADEVVARAYSRIADPALAAMFKDSEAFAEWCTTGRLPATPPNVAVSVPGVAPASPPAAPAAPAAAKAAPRKKPRPAAKAKPARAAAPGRKKAKPAAKKARSRKPARKAPARAARKKASKRARR